MLVFVITECVSVDRAKHSPSSLVKTRRHQEHQQMSWCPVSAATQTTMTAFVTKEHPLECVGVGDDASVPHAALEWCPEAAA